MYLERIKDLVKILRLGSRKFKCSDEQAVYKYGSNLRMLKYFE